MLCIISPAKRIGEESKIASDYTLSRTADKTRLLIDELKRYHPGNLQKLMGISPKLADLNVARYQEFKSRHSQKYCLQPLFAFQGDVYLGMEANTFDAQSITFAQQHLRILSGLYGLLRPLDLIQPYRLEMGTKLKVGVTTNLYEFWGDSIRKLILSDMRKINANTLVNLASNEYFKAINAKKINKRILNVTFKQYKDGKLKFISIFGKRARGLMCRYIVENKITDTADLKGFNLENYYFEEKLSAENEMVFVR